jgi:hypothetical protein
VVLFRRKLWRSSTFGILYTGLARGWWEVMINSTYKSTCKWGIVREADEGEVEFVK